MRSRRMTSRVPTVLLILTLALLALAIGVVRPALAEVYVLGDSIGEDLGRVAKQKTLAKVSVSLANRWIYKQLPQVPPGSTVVLELGTNDADNTGGVGHLGKHIDALVEALTAARHKVYWLGPVCTTTASDARSAQLDKILADRLAATSVTYISLRKPALCDPSLHARDGQHMRDAGSKAIWQEVTRIAGLGEEPQLVATRSPPAPIAAPVAPAAKPAAAKQLADAPRPPAAPVAKPAVAAKPEPVPTPAAVARSTVGTPPAATPAAIATPTPRPAVVASASARSPVNIELRPLGVPRKAATVAPAALPPAGTPKPAATTAQPAPAMAAAALETPQPVRPPPAPAAKPVLVSAPAPKPLPTVPVKPAPKSCFLGLFSC